MKKNKMNNLESCFSKLKQQEQKVFVAYLNAGDPDLDTTFKIMEIFVKNGVDIIELGVPFSDPIGDGPVNQEGAMRALKHGVTLHSVLNLVKRFKTKYNTPVVLFSYLNPIYNMGLEQFSIKASKAMVDGVLIVDSPFDMSFKIVKELHNKNIDSIFLVAPTTQKERLKAIVKYSSGFVYYVSSLGVTGERSRFDKNLANKVKEVKKNTNKPVCIGFGISTPETAKRFAKLSDGVIVGSAFVSIIADNLKNKQKMLKKLSIFSKAMVSSVKQV